MTRIDELRMAYLDFLLAMVEEKFILEDPIECIAVEALYEHDYIPHAGNDVNRISDAEDLRQSFLDLYLTTNLNRDLLSQMPVSILEVFIALAVRAGDTIVSSSSQRSAAAELFNSMFLNMPLHTGDKDYTNSVAVAYQLNHIEFDGYGGPFPLKHPSEDQRNVELWYQMMAYFGENYDTDGRKHSEYVQIL